MQRVSLAALWQEIFRRTYTTEFRGESADTVRSIYEAGAQRYDQLGTEALQALAARGGIARVDIRGYAVEIESAPASRRWARARWHLMRPWSKALTFCAC